jgi:hypothetical protein
MKKVKLWILQVMFPPACSFIVLVFTVSLHVSAYMAIFRSVGRFIFKCLKDSASPTVEDVGGRRGSDNF